MAQLKRKNNEQISPTSSSKKMINVLSFDGGGSRGIMEAMVLDDFMRLVTLMKEDPKTNLIEMLRNNDRYEFVRLLHPQIKRNENNTSLLHGACSNEFQSGNEFQWLGESLSSLYRWKWPPPHDEIKEDHDEIPKKLIHPTEIFDLIAGKIHFSLI